MKIYHTDGNVYYFEFKRHQQTNGVIVTECDIFKKVGFDEATNKPTLKLLSSGQSKCNPLDLFDKDKGRKLALERALNITYEEATDFVSPKVFSREFRKEVFRQYGEYIEGSKEVTLNKIPLGDVLNA